MLSAAPQTVQDRYGHLIAGEKNADGIFFQLVIYATRAGWVTLDQVEENAVIQRFRSRFSRTAETIVACLRPGEDLRPAEIFQILDETWTTVKQTYSLPGSARGFSRHVQDTITGKVKTFFSRNGSESSATDIDIDQEMPGLKKRGDNVWANGGSRDQADDFLTPKEVAARTGISERTVFKLIERREISAEQRGTNWLIPSEGEKAAQAWQAKNQARLRRSGLNKIYIAAWAKKRGTPLPSAATQIHRWRADQATDEDITGRIGEKWVKAAARKAETFLTEREYEALIS